MMAEDQPGVSATESLNTSTRSCRKNSIAVLSFSPPPSGPPSKTLRIGSMQRMSGAP
jgi:hypothetical protein